MDLGLKGKRAVVTGGASGLGRETAHYLVRDGARVLIADINEANIAAVVNELRQAGGDAHGVTADVRDYAACKKMAVVAKEKLGGVDILVAAAGVSTSSEHFLDTEPNDWDLMLEVNIRGLMNTNRAIAPLIVESGSGAIVNIASEAGKVGERRIVVYSATKGAVISFSKALALELGRNKIRVNAVCPGVTRSPMTARFGEPGSEFYEKAAKLYPMGRLGEPEDIAAMITFLVSEQAAWVTGQAISVSGGFGRS
ncbi:MAG: SDR family NAD(P)-dependent oxidoreductase [Candidatus Hydrogenedentales bacterium]